MSITIKLDAPALRALIDDDASFKLELQRSVTAEMLRTFLLKDVANSLPAIVPEAINALREDAEFQAAFAAAAAALLTRQSWGTRTTLTPEGKALIDDQINSLIIGRFNEIQKTTHERLDAYLAGDSIPAALRLNIDRKIQRAIDQGVDARMAEIKAAL